MADYEPTSRRPIARIFRRTAEVATRFCVAIGVSPDIISYLSIVAAIGAAFCFWKSMQHPALLVIAPLLCFLRLWFNMLDGMVAVAAAQASLRGEIVNDLPDRISDIIIFVGVAHSGWMRYPILGYWVVILALLTAYVGLFGQAIGAGRQFGGSMSKPWRMVVLALGSWGMFLFRTSFESMERPTIIDWSCLIIIGGCGQTIVMRLKEMMRSLREKSR
ncbi:MAG TPA: CDP-alcohol phosphatidyltransferase family protein [Chthoniobacterales bacterium]|jgi:phosphatidylglycerophosphate synthase